MMPVPTDRHCGGPIAVRLRTGMRVLAGCFFLVTGAAKMPVIPEVASVARAVTGTGESVSAVIAALIIGAEVAIGTLLIIAVRPRFAAAAGIVCMGVFGGAIGSLLLHGVELDCHCFGALGVRLRLGWELVLDLAIAGYLLTLIRLLPAEHRPGERMRAAVIGMVSLSLSGSATMASAPLTPPDDGREILHRADWGGNRPTPRLILLIDQRELQCSLCFDDLLALNDSLRGLGSAGWERTLTIMRGNESGGMSERDLQIWGTETGIAGPIWIPGAEEYDAFHPGPNEALLLQPDGRVSHRMEFPLGRGSREQLLATLTAP